MPVVHFVNEDKTIEVDEGSNLRKVALRHGINPYKGKDRLFNCRGFGLCGTCRVDIIDGTGASPQTDREVRALRSLIPFYAREWGKDVRLSCRVEVKGDLKVKTYPEVSIDREETKIRLANFAAILIFGGGLLLMIGLILLDMLKLL
jgi:ferredoxin